MSVSNTGGRGAREHKELIDEKKKKKERTPILSGREGKRDPHRVGSVEREEEAAVLDDPLHARSLLTEALYKKSAEEEKDQKQIFYEQDRRFQEVNSSSARAVSGDKKEPSHSQTKQNSITTPYPSAHVDGSKEPVSSVHTGAADSLGRDIHRKSMLKQANDDWMEKMREKPSSIGDEWGPYAEKSLGEETEDVAFDKDAKEDDVASLLSLQRGWEQREEEAAQARHADGEDYRKEWEDFPKTSGEEDTVTPESIKKSSRYLTSGAERLWKMEYRSLATAGRFTLSYVEQADAGKGMRITEENVIPAMTILYRFTKRNLGTFAAASLEHDKGFQEALAVLKTGYFKDKPLHIPKDGHWDMQDVRLLQQDIRLLLHKDGVGRFSADGAFMSPQLFRASLKGRFSDAEYKALYKVAKKTAEIQGLSSRHKMRQVYAITHLPRKYMRQDSTMNAMLLSESIARHTTRILQNSLHVAAVAAKGALFISQKALLLSAKAVTAAAKTRLAQALAEKSAVAGKAVKAASGAEKAAGKAVAGRATKAARKTAERAARKEARAAFFDRVLPHRILQRKVLRPAKAFITRGRFNPLGFLGKAIGAASGVFHGLTMLIGVFLAAAALFCIFVLSVTAILEHFNWGSNEKETRDKCFDIIASCWDTQMSQMENYGSGQGYRNVIYTFNDKDDDPDNDHKTNEAYLEEEFDYTETTNTVEMLSMAQVYFDFDLEGADDTELANYLRGLYNGSHVITTKEVESEEKDENGNAKYTDLEVILTTYYFDELFDCAITSASYSGGESAIAGESFDIPQDFKQSITYEGTMEWAAGVATSPSNPMRQVIDAWYENGENVGTAADGMESTPCIIVGGQKRYLCAVVPHFGQIGDYVDAYLEDGTILPLILIDNKGCYDGGSYHNLTTNFMFNNFHYGHTLSPGDQSVCSVLEFMKSSSSPSGNPSSYCTRLAPVSGSSSSSIKVTRLVNGGSFLKNPSGPKYVNGDSSQIDVNNANAQEFLSKLAEISSTVQQYASNVVRSSGCERTYSTFRRKLRNGEKAEINCIGPAKWALEELGLLPEGSTFYGSTEGTFRMPSGQSRRKLLSKMDQISDGGAIGMTLNEAVKEGKLQPGDILNLSSSTYNHSVVYAGTDANGHPLVYDGGGEAEKQGYDKVGCLIDYSNSYKNSEIRTILRWK